MKMLGDSTANSQLCWYDEGSQQVCTCPTSALSGGDAPHAVRDGMYDGTDWLRLCENFRFMLR